VISIRAIALDVDGVLTDGGFWWNAAGEEWKRFSFLDVMGLANARRAGLILALISGEDSLLVDRFAEKLGIKDVFKRCKDKASALRDFADRHDLELTEICFMGDDINDLGALAIAGLSAAPPGAHESVLRAVTFVATRPGGNGAVRDLVDAVLTARESGAVKGA
jgi:3-deoxy-D-manno-octulosonate 8-phosphate phosphatase (KDO 8-P phosphatase)